MRRDATATRSVYLTQGKKNRAERKGRGGDPAPKATYEGQGGRERAGGQARQPVQQEQQHLPLFQQQLRQQLQLPLDVEQQSPTSERIRGENGDQSQTQDSRVNAKRRTRTPTVSGTAT